MSEDRLIPSGEDRGFAPVPAEPMGPLAAPFPDSGYYDPPTLPERSSGPGFSRYVAAVMRRKGLLVASVFVGMVGAYLGWTITEPQYTAEGNLWIEVATRSSMADVAPIRQGNVFESGAWLELLKSFAVLDPVVLDQRLYLEHPEEFAEAFSTLRVGMRFLPGDYELTVSEDGTRFALAIEPGGQVGVGTVGEAIGTNQGFEWTPPEGTLPPGSEISFRVVPPRDASSDLREELLTRMSEAGNFIRLSLKGPDAAKVTAILNSVMERHVGLAAELKRSKLVETRDILEEQLVYTQSELESAEQALQQFRINTITLPTDESPPIAAGLEMTTNPVFSSFFGMRVELEQLRRDRGRVEAVLNDDNGGLRIEALEIIPVAAASSELSQVLSELVEARSQLRVYRDRYEDEYPLIQVLLTRIETIETEAVPRVVNGLVNELRTRELELDMRLDSASAELQAIPPRTIEEARLRRQVAIQERLNNDLTSRVETSRLASASSIPDVRILDQATVPLEPTDDPRLPLAALFFAGPVGLVIALAVVLDRLDPRLRYPAEISDEIGLQILGSIPRIIPGTGRKAEENAAQVLEAFRELRVTLGFAYGSAGPMTLTITSPAQGEGKSLITTNLAVAFAEMGRRTLLIDGDTRRGDAHRLLGLERSPGLVDYLKERNGRDIIQSTQYPKLDYLGSGIRGANAPELLASARMASFLGTLKRAYEVILVDSPPLAAGGDALILGGLTGNLAMVVRTGSTEKLLTLAKLESLQRLPIRILGAVLNDVEPSSRAYRYYSSYLPGYEAGSEEEQDSEAQPQLLTQGDEDDA